MTHTSTSPNYQILASLDVGRRQVELEGYEMVEQRDRPGDDAARARSASIPTDPALLLGAAAGGHDPRRAPAVGPGVLLRPRDRAGGAWTVRGAWTSSRSIPRGSRCRSATPGSTATVPAPADGPASTSRSTRPRATPRCSCSNIGTTRGDVAYLVEVLAQIARRASTDRLATESGSGLAMHTRRRSMSLLAAPPLPHFSRFHPAFQPSDDAGTPRRRSAQGVLPGLRRLERRCECLNHRRVAHARSWKRVARWSRASFVTPYPPGFPMLVPGQVVSRGDHRLPARARREGDPRLPARLRAARVHRGGARSAPRRRMIRSEGVDRHDLQDRCRHEARRRRSRPRARSLSDHSTAVDAEEAARHLRHPPVLPPQRRSRSTSSARRTSICSAWTSGSANFTLHQLHRLLRRPAPERLRARRDPARAVRVDRGHQQLPAVAPGGHRARQRDARTAAARSSS